MNKTIKTLTIVVIVVGVFLISFIALMCWFYYKFQSTPDILIQYVLGAGVIELIITAIITIFNKVLKKNDIIDSEE